MNGLELARRYYEAVGRPALERDWPELLPRMAVGLAGEGSECFGFDDELSRDHDWGPAFCLWLSEADYAKYGARVQAWYKSLPGELDGFAARTDSTLSGGRVGCLCTPRWYRKYTGCSKGPETLREWRRVPEHFLATAVNGAVFDDPSGEFTAIRNRLQKGYPEDVRIKKIVARAAVMAQAGQYNYPRCRRRGDRVAAGLAQAEFVRAAMSMVYLLNRTYAPYYKWMYRGLRGFPILPRVSELLGLLCAEGTGGAEAEDLIERICLLTVGELLRQGLTDRNDAFLQAHCAGMMQRIRDPELRRAHFMEE